MTLYEELKWRGLVYNISDEALIDKLNKGEYIIMKRVILL